ncbi:MAG: hypothetical protein ACOX1P_26065 [Thermoguttaceae bacterium]|jgi:hypothetical protein
MIGKNPLNLGLCLVIATAAAVGSQTAKAVAADGSSSGSWTIQQVRILEGFQIPECVCIDPETGYGYVSNIVCPKGEQDKVDAKDGTGFITRLKPGGEIDSLRWVDSAPGAALNSIKGMCILDGILYAADIDRVVRYRIQAGTPGKPIPIEGAKLLNDMVSDGSCAYVSDTLTGKIHRLRGERVELVATLAGANGITFAKGKMYAVSVAEHEIYEMDPNDNWSAHPFGLADRFQGLDGIEVLADGSFLVSDVLGHKVSHVDAGQTTERLLSKLAWPADIGLDRRRNLLFVPQFWDSRVIVYQLEQAGKTTGTSPAPAKP